MKKLISALLIVGCFVAMPGYASADKKLPVTHYWQKDGCWCGVALIEMVEQFYRGKSWKWYPQRQANLAKTENNGGLSVGTIAEGNRTNIKPCGQNGGLDGNELPMALNYRLRSFNKNFRWGSSKLTPSPVDKNYKQSKHFHELVMSGIKSNDVVIFAGHTRYKNKKNNKEVGVIKKGQHWYLIIGYKDADGDPKTISHNDGYYIHDPAVNDVGLYKNLYTLGQKGKFVSHFNMMKHLAERFSSSSGSSGSKSHIVYYIQKS